MKSFPYNAVISGYDEEGMPIFDRAIDATEQRKWTSIFYTNGVLADNGAVQNFKVTASSSGMKVLVSPGVCNINGVIGIETDQRELVLDPAEVYDRIDLIVLRLDEVARTLDLYVRKGTAGAAPTAPKLIRPLEGESGDIYEMCLAQISVGKNSTKISDSRITDTRLNNTVCGIITNAINNLNTSSYYTRFENTLASQKDKFEAWFETIQLILNENEAGALINLISKVNSQYEVVIPKSGWQLNSMGMYEQTITNANAAEYEKSPMWFLLDKGTTAAAIEAEENAYACLSRMEFGNKKIKLTCKKDLPEISFTVMVVLSGAEMLLNSADLAGVLSYESLLDKPSINSVQLTGNKSFSDLGINELIDTDFLNETEGEG